MKICLTVILLSGLMTACSGSYSVDFRNIRFPGKSKLDQLAIDSILNTEKADTYRKLNDSLFAKTDKKTYHFGEVVVLEVVNNSSQTEYLYESDEDTKARLSTFPNAQYPEIKDFRKKLVSDNPAIGSAVLYSDPSFVTIYLAGVNGTLAEKMGVEAFEDPLEPGETMIFKVVMPDRPGHYRFRLRKYAHSTFGAWGLNREIISNVFEIVAK